MLYYMYLSQHKWRRNKGDISMRFAIIEDTQEDCMLLLTLLKQYMAHYDFTSEFSLFTSGEDFLANVQPDLYDLCFMDIFMDGMNGVQTAEALRQIDPSCLVIFLTTSPDFFADGFRLRAWRYLLKPITLEQLAEALPECIEQINLSARQLTVIVKRSAVALPFSQIHYVISCNRSIEIHGENAVLTTGKQLTFAELTAPLRKDFRFIEVSKGIVVNLDFAKVLERNDLLMKNGDRLPISRPRISEVSEALVRFQFMKR